MKYVSFEVDVSRIIIGVEFENDATEEQMKDTLRLYFRDEVGELDLIPDDNEIKITFIQEDPDDVEM